MKNLGKYLVVLAVLVVLGAAVFVYRGKNNPATALQAEQATLPLPTVSVPTIKPSTASTPIPDELNLDVPFMVQAPLGVWDALHEETCEEAAILMAQKYLDGQKFLSSQDAENNLQQIVSWEKQNLGFFESTTADQTAEVARRDLGLQAEVIATPSIDEIKNLIASGKLVVLPVAGQQIGNPFYTAPGPIYHMLLIKGYTATQFISNDAGTKRGANYPYNFNTILNANHDWNGVNDANGAKNVLVIWK